MAKNFKEIIRSIIVEITGLSEPSIEVPKDPSMGDYAFPCFQLSKEMKKPPVQVAEDLVSRFKDMVMKTKEISKVVAMGPYLNFFVDKSSLAGNVLSEIDEAYGKGEKRKDKVMVEYCQVNTHKAFHVGHLRGTLLGMALVRLLRFSGFEVISANYQGDIGAHVAKSLWYLIKHYDGEYPTENKGIWLGKIYQKANALLFKKEEYKREVSEILVKLESGDKELTELWKKTRQWSLDDFEEIYRNLDVGFDEYFFESHMEKPGKELVRKMVSEGLAYEDEGAIIIDLEKFNLAKLLLLKSDGTALYSTKDLALAKAKFEKYNVERSLYVVGSEQRFYFQQIFKTLELMGFLQAKKCFHLPYDLVTLEGGKISSREGELILALELIDEAVDYASREVRKRHETWSDDEVIASARAVAMAGIKFAMISHDNNKQIVFKMENVLDFEGETGPYIQYVHARISSILRSYEGKMVLDDSQLETEEDRKLITILSKYPSVIKDATESYRLTGLCRYLIELSQAFNEYYHKNKILGSDEESSRVFLVSKVRFVIASGLGILGIKAPEKM